MPRDYVQFNTRIVFMLMANTVAGSASGTHSLVNYRCSRNYFSSTRVFFKTVTLHDLSLGIGETQIFHWTNVKTVRIPNTTTFVMTSQYTLWLSLDYWWVFQLIGTLMFHEISLMYCHGFLLSAYLGYNNDFF